MSPGDRYTTPLGKKLPQINRIANNAAKVLSFHSAGEILLPVSFTYEVGLNMTYYNNLWKVKADEGETSLKNPWKRRPIRRTISVSPIMTGACIRLRL